MSVTSKFYPFDRQNVLFTLDQWKAMLEEVVEQDPLTADAIALTLFELIKALMKGPDPGERTINTLKLGIEWLFRRGSSYALSFTLYLYFLEGLLKESDLPEQLIGGAMDRAEAETVIAPKTAQAKKPKVK